MYAVIVWTEGTDPTTAPGTVYGWYESLATALKTATNLTLWGVYAHSVAAKAL